MHLEAAAQFDDELTLMSDSTNSPVSVEGNLRGLLTEVIAPVAVSSGQSICLIQICILILLAMGGQEVVTMLCTITSEGFRFHENSPQR